MIEHTISIRWRIAAAIVLVSLNALSAVTAGEPEQTVVYRSGQDGYNTYRIPALVVTTRGTLLAFCEGRKTGQSDHGDIDLLLKRSIDQGGTWSSQQVVYEEGGGKKVTIGNPCAVVDHETGVVWLAFCRNNDLIFITYSDDDGLTWAKPIEITKDVKDPKWDWYATGPGHGIQLQYGPHKGRLVIPCDCGDSKGWGQWDEKGRSLVIYSDDHGKSWQRGEITEKSMNECEVVEIANGALLLSMRNYHGKNRRAFSVSHNGGQNWSKPKHHEQVYCPTCQSSIHRYSVKPKNIVLYSGPGGPGRTGMTIRASYDEGWTWPVSQQLHAGPSAYSELARLPNGDIVCLYESGEKQPYEWIRFARFPLRWLTGPELEKDADQQPIPGRSRYLLLDSRIIDKTENARLAVGTVKKHPANPLFCEDKSWEVRFDNLYANVLYDQQENLYKCWYSPFIVDPATSETPRQKRAKSRYRPHDREMGICYATSKDGLKWDKPELGLIEFDGSMANNLVLRGPHGAGIFKDIRETDPKRRYKLFCQGMNVRFSADGLHWSDPISCREIDAAGDTHNNAFRAPKLGKYVGITRLWEGQRIVGRTESLDFVKWTKAAEVLRGDRQNQTYAMPVFCYADVYLGLVMILRRDGDRVHCELTWSPDTIKWERIDKGTPLIPNSENKGDYDWGCAYAAAYPVFLENEIRLYYGGSNGTHGGFRDGCLALATLRPDGFAGYEPQNKEKDAVVVTKPLLWSGGTLRVTADAKGGSVKVLVLDTEGRTAAVSKSIKQNITNGTVHFKAPLQLKGSAVRLQFELQKARLYSFAIDK